MIFKMSCQNITPITKLDCNPIPNNESLKIDLQKMEVKLGDTTLGKITGFIVNNGFIEQRIDINTENLKNE
jgi:hypothetical protein